METNKHAFQTIEFDAWAEASTGLAAEEAFLIERFLDNDKRLLEAGVGGGRLLRALQERGFEALAGFDFVPEMIEQARRVSEALDLRVMEAHRLLYPDDYFDQAIYLGQILCFLEDAEKRQRAVGESFRVLKENGVALFSFLVLEARYRSPLHRCLLAYLKLLRFIKRDPRSLHYQPWLRRGGRPSVRALLDQPPYVYWFTVAEAVRLLRDAGFTIHHVATSSDLRAGILHASAQDLGPIAWSDKVYVVCRK